MIKILTTLSFEKRLKKFKKNHPDLKSQYHKTLITLQKNPFHPSLRLNKLQGNIRDYYSISINLRYRNMIDFIIKEDKIILIDIGKHDYLYR